MQLKIKDTICRYQMNHSFKKILSHEQDRKITGVYGNCR